METPLQQFMTSKSQTPTSVCRKRAFPIENLEIFKEEERLLGNSEEAKQYLVLKILISIVAYKFLTNYNFFLFRLEDCLFIQMTQFCAIFFCLIFCFLNSHGV